MKNILIASGAMLLAATGCQSTGEGALTGAAVGAYEGCSRAGTCWGRARDHGHRRYDRYSGRYYYVDPEYGDTYWEDGSFREYGGHRGRGYRRGY